MKPSISTSLTVTNPLVLYRTLLALKQIDPDPAQHRLCLELQKIYYRLKDYNPQAEYGARLKAISESVENVAQGEEHALAAPGHPIRQNPFFSKLFKKQGGRDTLALTRVLTSHESAMNLNSPRGFLLHGEVGTGKSMLLDLLADSLPTSKKRRWHFNTFMLETISRLEHLRQSRQTGGGNSSEYSLIWLAKEMIENSPILFLDEFQLPDRAASKILSNLFTAFFQLGGVLIASSNRMPDELAKASGMDFSAPAKGGVVGRWLGLGSGRSRFPADNEYSQFVDVLKARCDIWDMEGGRDWRRREVEEMDEEAAEIAEIMREEMISGFTKSGALPSEGPGSQNSAERESNLKAVSPKQYILSTDSNEGWEAVISSAFDSENELPIPWQSTSLRVYGRQVLVPKHLNGVAYWDFSDLCEGSFGPADYITLASTFHTLILDNVPVLTISQKNEARRLITLLDALYEARCKLIMRAAAGPDELFFPEFKAASSMVSSNGISRDENDGGDAVYPETLSEIYQDQTSPFRPNISSYKEEHTTGYDPDEDSDFGPEPGKGNEIGRRVDFGMTSSFTGEDERFAYKRARSRLWEMCGARWHARSEPGWWKPLSVDLRRWEKAFEVPTPQIVPLDVGGDVKMGDSIELDRAAGLQGKELEEAMYSSPFREPREAPPQIGESHAWGMTKWGKKAGAWGQGVDGLNSKSEVERRRGK